MHALLNTHPRAAILILLLMLPVTVLAFRLACLMVPAVLHGVVVSVAESASAR